jgi:5'-methylthioadenosine phosphorylase
VPKLRHHDGPCVQGCHTALDSAIVTPKDQRDPEMVEKLWVVAGRVL